MRALMPPPPQISKIQLCTLLESLPEAVFIVDREGRLLQANTPAGRYLGEHRSRLCEPQQLRQPENGSSAPEQKVVPIRERQSPVEIAVSLVRRALNGERIHNQRCVLPLVGSEEAGGENKTGENRTGENKDESKKDENQVETLVSANPIIDPADGVLGALVVIRDITEVNELHRRLAASERDHAIGQMAAGLIHDFNNVLETVDQAIAVMEMRQEATREQQLSYLAMMHRAVRRGSEITGRLRQYLRSGTGVSESLDLRELLEDTVELARPMLHSSHNNVRLNSQIQPVGRVRGNAADLRRMFTNLILNALQAMPHGGELEVHCETVAGQRSGDRLAANHGSRARVQVCDTGAGIPAHVQKKIFRPYFTTKPAGTGLGLSESQRIVHSMGGRIHFHSEQGRGTRFVVELPLIAESGQHGNEREQKGVERTSAPGRAAGGDERPSVPHVA
jgi:signal transduction histidine kinase